MCTEVAPPRPPLPGGDIPPPRPPPPETDDEEEMFMHAPQPNQPIMVRERCCALDLYLLYIKSTSLKENIENLQSSGISFGFGNQENSHEILFTRFE